MNDKKKMNDTTPMLKQRLEGLQVVDITLSIFHGG